ncbi:hypothetical protein BX600DRAFT_555357 [Xylariales sp. PMI_506]|nr:hypothetical protein BX600DRAFT_555357 [Xylariales sp. PMI_506]
MKYLTAEERKEVVGEYFAPEGLYEYTKSLPFLGTVQSNVQTLVAGQWTEIVLTYEVGASGLADGAWIKGTFKFYSDWALFQTSDRTKDNYVSAEYEPRDLHPGQTPATVQSLNVRFDQKGHERPFQKAVIIDIVDGYLNAGDKIVIRLGDRRWGARGTRVQTFVEQDFRWRFYIDPVGTSRFAPIQPDIVWNIVPGEPHRLEAVSPRVVRPGVPFNILVHAEDIWGNVTKDIPGLNLGVKVISTNRDAAHDVAILEQHQRVADKGWSHTKFTGLVVPGPGSYIINATLKNANGDTLLQSTSPITISHDLTVPKALFGDLHVHSDDTVGTENSTYNFTYGRDVAGLDVLGYTANDFQITKARWDATTELIKSLNEPGSFVIFPGTEWCGNSAAGGDHNVVFLGDPSSYPPEFPFDRHGNVARSFEWSEDGPKDLVPGAWPLDEVYATYAADAEQHLMIPHVGGRRCNLAWHHPKLERLLEIGSAWGQFEWLLRDAVRRGWKLGVSANSDEHRGRCGGGVPGTAVFGTRGGLTGILAPALERGEVAGALRARHTFATTGPRLVGLVATVDGKHIQGDEVDAPAVEPLRLDYHFLGNTGFSSIEAFDATGCVWRRDLWSESNSPKKIIRVSWGGARLYDRYREAVWDGQILVSPNATIIDVKTFGGFSYNPEDQVELINDQILEFASRTSGDTDGVHLAFGGDVLPDSVSIQGTLGGYVKVGDPLKGHPHKAQPTFKLKATWAELSAPGGKKIEIAGGAELFLAAEAIPAEQLPTELRGSVEFQGAPGDQRAIYFVGREWSGDKVVSSPLFAQFT